MKTFRFFVQSEQEPGDDIGQPGADGQKLELVLPDGFDLVRVDPDKDQDYTYSLTQGGQKFFDFTILPAAVIPGIKLPAAVVLREKGDDKEGTLES
jgi:hypothetical protein